MFNASRLPLPYVAGDNGLTATYRGLEHANAVTVFLSIVQLPVLTVYISTTSDAQ